MREPGLRNKVAIVTGGAAGLGHATARRFAEEGCRVAVWDVHDRGAIRHSPTRSSASWTLPTGHQSNRPCRTC